MTWVVLSILWIAISLQIINCVNKDGAKTSWDGESLYKRLFYVVVIPALYLFLGAHEAFKK